MKRSQLVVAVSATLFASLVGAAEPANTGFGMFSASDLPTQYYACVRVMASQTLFERQAAQEKGNLTVAQAEAIFARHTESLYRQGAFRIAAEELERDKLTSGGASVDSKLQALYAEDSEAAVQEFGRLAAHCNQFFDAEKAKGGPLEKAYSFVRNASETHPEYGERAKAEFIEAVTAGAPEHGDAKPRQ